MEYPSPYHDKVQRLRVFLRVFAPFFALAVFLMRSYLECGVFDPYLGISYYRVVHQVVWFLLLFGLLLLGTSKIVRMPLEKVLWLSYTLPVIFLPVVYAWLTGSQLRLDYHHGEPEKILLDIATFVWTAPHNHPVILDAAASVLGMAAIGWFYTRSVLRGALTGLLFFCLASFMAVGWLAPQGAVGNLFTIPTRLYSHNFCAAYLTVAFSLVVVALLVAGGLFKGRGGQLASGLISGAAVFAVYYWAASVFRWFEFPFDRIMTGVPIATSAFSLTLIFYGVARRPVSRWAVGTLAGLLVLQAAAFGPIYAGKEGGLTGLLPPRWVLGDGPFSHLTLLPEEGKPDFLKGMSPGTNGGEEGAPFPPETENGSGAQ